jgi:hypothetical protein
MKIGTMTGGVDVVTTINLTYLPEFIVLPSTCKKILINVLGDGVVVDLDQRGISSLGELEKFGINGTEQTYPSNGNPIYTLRLADGIILNKNVTIELTNDNAAASNIFGFSTSKGNLYVQNLRQTVFANSGTELKSFLNLSLVNGSGTDDIQVTFTDGTTQKFDITELPVLLSMQQNITRTTNDYILNNTNGAVSLVNYIPTNQTQIYIRRVALTKNAVLNSSVN